MQNNNEQKTVNTRGYQTSNGNAIKASAMEWSYQGDMLKILITPELPENEQSEKRRYDYDHSWITCIPRLKCLDLYKQMETKVKECMEKKEDVFVSVPLAEVNQFGFGVKFDENGKPTAYAKLIRNINPENLTSQDEIVYEFKKGEVIVNYDNTTGNFGGRELNETELELFINDLHCFVQASSKAFTHANRVVDKYHKDTVMGAITSIANKVGAEVSTYNSASRAGARYGGASLFDNTSSPAPTETITSLEELGLD